MRRGGAKRGDRASRFLTNFVAAACWAAPAISSPLGDAIQFCADPDIRVAERGDLARAAGWQDVDSLTFPAYQELLVQKTFSEYVRDGQKVGPENRERLNVGIIENNPIEKITENGPLLTLNGKLGPFLRIEEQDLGTKYWQFCTIYAVSESEFSRPDEILALTLPGFSGEKLDYVKEQTKDLMNRFSMMLERRTATNDVRARVKVFVVDFDPEKLAEVTGTPFTIDLELWVVLDRMLP